jgi:radical SAM superfamily enzyme YgiQ (UPF0313 family)
MADILFIQHRTFERANTWLLQQKAQVAAPLPFIYMASYLEQRGISVEIVDMRLEIGVSAIRRGLAGRPRLVGFSCMMGPQIRSMMRLSRFIKRAAPTLPIVYGGVHASSYPLLCLQEDCVDYVVVGEGEETLAELVGALAIGKSPHDIQGLASKVDGEPMISRPRGYINLDQAPRGAWHLVEKYLPFYAADGLKISTARGCPFRCRFCYNTIFNRKFRERSAASVLDEIEFLVRRYGVRSIRFLDDNFVTNSQRTSALADGLAASKPGVEFHVSMRIDDMTEEWLPRLSRAGLRTVFAGVEVGTDKGLAEINKQVTTADVFAAARVARSCGVRNIYSFTFGYPNETAADIQALIEIAEQLHEIDPRSRCVLEIVTPTACTPLFEEVVRKYGYAPPQTLWDWSYVSWKEARSKPWIEQPGWHEAFQLMFYLAFLPTDTCGAMSVLRKWARRRISRPGMRHLGEFHLLKNLSRWFSY